MKFQMTVPVTFTCRADSHAEAEHAILDALDSVMHGLIKGCITDVGYVLDAKLLATLVKGASVQLDPVMILMKAADEVLSEGIDSNIPATSGTEIMANNRHRIMVMETLSNAVEYLRTGTIPAFRGYASRSQAFRESVGC